MPMRQPALPGNDDRDVLFFRQKLAQAWDILPKVTGISVPEIMKKLDQLSPEEKKYHLAAACASEVEKSAPEGLYFHVFLLIR